MNDIPIPADNDRAPTCDPDGSAQPPPPGTASPHTTGPTGATPLRRRPQVADPAQRWARGVLAAWALLFCLACFLPALRFHIRGVATPGGPPPSYYYGAWGAWLLVFGWAAPFVGQFGWLANPLAIVSLGLQQSAGRKSRLAAVIWSALAMLVAMDTLTLFGRHIPVPYLNPGYNDTYQLTGLLPGFYVWLASLAVLLIGAVVAQLRYADTAGGRRWRTAGRRG